MTYTHKFNPLAAIFWAFLGCLGWLFASTKGAVAGIALGLFVSLIASRRS